MRSLLLHVKGNPGYSRKSIEEKSKESTTWQSRGAQRTNTLQTEHPAPRQGTEFGLLLSVEAGCQNAARQPQGETARMRPKMKRKKQNSIKEPRWSGKWLDWDKQVRRKKGAFKSKQATVCFLAVANLIGMEIQETEA